MTRERIQPTRTPAPADWDDSIYRETHPAYGLIGASRVTTTGPRGGEALFGSDFTHGQYIIITIREAESERALSADRFYSRSRLPLVQVAVSEAQWATFVSTFNIGEGIPCTIQQKTAENGWEQVPGIESITDRREQTRDEVKQTVEDAVAKLDALLDDIDKGKAKSTLREQVKLVRQELVSNLPFVVNGADEHMEKTVESAKVEVSAYLTGAIQRAGLAALQGEAPLLSLNAGEVVDHE